MALVEEEEEEEEEEKPPFFFKREGIVWCVRRRNAAAAGRLALDGGRAPLGVAQNRQDDARVAGPALGQQVLVLDRELARAHQRDLQPTLTLSHSHTLARRKKHICHGD